MNRLRSLMDELEVDEAVFQTAVEPHGVERGDPFFTAQVLAALPSRLAFTGLTPLERVAILSFFYVVAGAVAVAVGWTFAPGLLDNVAHHAHGWFEGVAEVPWTWGVAAVVLVGVVAFGVTRSHTRTA